MAEREADDDGGYAVGGDEGAGEAEGERGEEAGGGEAVGGVEGGREVKEGAEAGRHGAGGVGALFWLLWVRGLVFMGCVVGKKNQVFGNREGGDGRCGVRCEMSSLEEEAMVGGISESRRGAAAKYTAGFAEVDVNKAGGASVGRFRTGTSKSFKINPLSCSSTAHANGVAVGQPIRRRGSLVSGQ